MNLRSLVPSLAVIGLGAALATAAGAADVLTGVYEGKLSCKGLVEGTASKSKQDITIHAVEGKGIVSMQIRAGATQIGQTVRTFVLDDAGKPDRAKLMGVDCPVNVATLGPLTLVADAVAKEGSEKATLKGTLTNTSGQSQILVCTFSAKRTSLMPEKFTFCDL
jgi:hypothetical protein